MAINDKAENKGEKFGGKVKEGAGKATGDDKLKAEGKGDQASANLKDGVEKLKGAAKNVTGGNKNKT